MPSNSPAAETRELGRFMVAEKQPGEFWRVYTKRGDPLGIIAWDLFRWKQFVFQAEDQTEFSWDRLAELCGFMKQLEEERHEATGIAPKH